MEPIDYLWCPRPQTSASRGQFGAVAAILVSLPSPSADVHCGDVVLSLWRGLLVAPGGLAHALQDFITHLKRSSAHPAGAPAEGKPALSRRDMWMAAQVGVALMRGCRCRCDWAGGFAVLQLLHRHSIHYIAFSRPSAPLPCHAPLCPAPHPSPCGVALMAVEICLGNDRLDGAIEVLKGCNWTRPPLPGNTDLAARAEGLLALAERHLARGLLEGAWQVLEALGACPVPAASVTAAACLHNRLLHSLLQQGGGALDRGGGALEVYRGMCEAGLQPLPSCLSALLAGLVAKGQPERARELCQAAVDEGRYAPLSARDPLQVVVPPGLERLEMHLLLQWHLRGLAGGQPDRPLLISFAAGTPETASPPLSGPSS